MNRFSFWVHSLCVMVQFFMAILHIAAGNLGPALFAMAMAAFSMMMGTVALLRMSDEQAGDER